MPDPETIDAGLTGGCQCGAVRYRITTKPLDVSYCHCRMCQRAVGNVFAALVMVRKEHVAWTRGAPTFFASSTAAERGFCQACGTPLVFRYTAGPNIELTVGSFDHPEVLEPKNHYGIESRVPWHVIGDSLPRQATNTASPYLKDATSRQDPAGT